MCISRDGLHNDDVSVASPRPRNPRGTGLDDSRRPCDGEWLPLEKLASWACVIDQVVAAPSSVLADRTLEAPQDGGPPLAGGLASQYLAVPRFPLDALVPTAPPAVAPPCRCKGAGFDAS